MKINKNSVYPSLDEIPEREKKGNQTVLLLTGNILSRNPLGSLPIDNIISYVERD